MKISISRYHRLPQHAIDFDSGCVIYPENNRTKRKIAETLYIKSEQSVRIEFPINFIIHLLNLDLKM